MQLKHVEIANFKGIRELTLDLSGPAAASPRQLTALIGDNGAGKTTALQAVALVLSLATRKTKEVAEFNWHGFLPERVSSLGPTRVALTVLLDQEEIETTKALFRQWYDSRPAEWRESHKVVEPADHPEIELLYEQGRLTSPQRPEGVNQFLGRYYIKVLKGTHPQLRDEFPKVGDVFWFDQDRNLAAAMSGREENSGPPPSAESWHSGVERLRKFLVGWWGYHTSPEKGGGKDYIVELERQLARLFPETRFRGIRPRETAEGGSADEFYVLLEREGRVYDIAEMSSGEQAVFPVLYEFARLDIAKSVVLIDELELHLHPPQQQALLAALPRLGPDCQFLLTTHSPYLEEVIPDEHEVRLGGGQPCL